MNNSLNGALQVAIQILTSDAQRVIWRNEWLKVLYGDNEFYRNVVTKAATEFWAIVQSSMLTDVIVTLGRLLDEPSTRADEKNICIRGVAKDFKLDEACQSKIKYHYDAAIGSFQRITAIRNCRIAHHDMAKATLSDSMWPTVEDIEIVIDSVCKSIDILRIASGDTPLHWASYRVIEFDELYKLLSVESH